MELSPSRRALFLPSPRALTLAGGTPALAFCLPSCVPVLSCCACLLWNGEKNGMMSEEGEDYLTWHS